MSSKPRLFPATALGNRMYEGPRLDNILASKTSAKEDDLYKASRTGTLRHSPTKSASQSPFPSHSSEASQSSLLFQPSSLMQSENTPIFLGGDGRLYDLHYRPIDAHPTPQISEMPQPHEFETLIDYEQALMQWKEECDAAVEDLKMPVLVGRCYSRPRVLFKAKKEPLNQYNPGIQRHHEEAASESDPWHAQLIPLEPDPYWYDCFEDYEEALCRWVQLCSSLPIIPPHPSQFASLLDLTIAKDELAEDGHTLDSNTRTSNKGRTSKLPSAMIILSEIRGIHQDIERHPSREKYNKNSVVNHKNSSGVVTFRDERWDYSISKDRGIFESFSVESKENISNAFTQAQLQKETASPRAKIRIARNSHEHRSYPRRARGSALKPTDYPEHKVLKTTSAASLVTESSAEDNPWESYIPACEVPGIEFSRLLDGQYRQHLASAIEVGLVADYRNRLCGSARDRIDQQEQLLSIQEIFDKLAAGNILKAQNVINLVTCNLSLDEFEVLLTEKNKQGFSNINVMMNAAISAEGPPSSLLDVVHEASLNLHQPIFAAKVSILLRKAIQTQNTTEAMKYMLCKRNAEFMFWFARALLYLEKDLENYFVYTDEHALLVEKTFGAEYGNLANRFFQVYYLKVIADKLTDVKLLHPIYDEGILNLLLAVKVKENFYSEFLEPCLGHRSIKLASVAMSIFSQLLTLPPKFSQIVSDSLFGAVYTLRVCARSRFSHVKFAVNHLFRLLTSGNFKTLLNQTYLVLMDNLGELALFQDLLLFPSSADQEYALFSQTLLAYISQIIDSTSLDESSSQNIEFFASIFQYLMSEMVAESADEALHSGGFVYIMARLMKQFIRLRLIDVADGNSKIADKGKKEKGSNRITVYTTEFIKLLSTLIQADGSKSIAFRTNLFVLIRRMMKLPELFAAASKDSIFLQFVIASCRESPSQEFTKNAWKTVYQVIRYQQSGVDYLIKGAQLNSCMDMLSPTLEPTILAVALHYLRKMFDLWNIEQRARDSGRDGRRDMDGRSVDRDLKTFLDYFLKKHHFIKIHVIFKQHQGKAPGMPFIELAKLYDLIATSAPLSKFYKEIAKNAEFRLGFQEISKMQHYGDVEQSKQGFSFWK